MGNGDGDEMNGDDDLQGSELAARSEHVASIPRRAPPRISFILTFPLHSPSPWSCSLSRKSPLPTLRLNGIPAMARQISRDLRNSGTPLESLGFQTRRRLYRVRNRSCGARNTGVGNIW